MHAIEAAFAGKIPAFDPIAYIKATIDPEFYACRQHAPDEVFGVDQFEAGSFWFQCECMNAAIGSSAAKIDEEKVILETGRQTCSREIGEAGGSAGDIDDWRHDVGSLAF